VSPWPRRILATLLLAAACHAATLWIVPSGVVALFTMRSAARFGINHASVQPLPTDQSRSVVRPSPDLLYAVCLYDVTDHPLLLESDLPDDYWSLSVFADNSDNAFAVNDRQAATRHPRYLLARAAKPAGLPPELADLPVIQAPSGTGVVLFRYLVLDHGAMEQAAAAQRSARCTPVESP
jgi:uncharacterized membrane protein